MVDDKKSQADTQEPSMEDILASIRRILSEEGEDKAGDGEVPAGDVDFKHATLERNTAPQLRPKETAASDEAVEQFTADPEAAARDGDAEVAFDSPGSPDGAMIEPDFDRKNELRGNDVLDLTPEMRANSMISPESALASTDVLAQLAKAILSRRDVAVGGSDVTIEGMVREMLRPMLKEWLDRNLPYLVERLVKREIDLMVNRAERLED